MAEYLIHIERGRSSLSHPVTVTEVRSTTAPSLGLEDLAWLIRCPLEELQLTRIATGLVEPLLTLPPEPLPRRHRPSPPYRSLPPHTAPARLRWRSTNPRILVHPSG